MTGWFLTALTALEAAGDVRLVGIEGDENYHNQSTYSTRRQCCSHLTVYSRIFHAGSVGRAIAGRSSLLVLVRIQSTLRIGIKRVHCCDLDLVLI